MIKVILCLALITIASAQFSQNFTQILMGWGSQTVRVVPTNVTEPDGTTYFELQRGTTDQAEGKWSLDLIGADGSISRLQNINNDLVLVAPNGAKSSIAAQLPPLLGINGAILVAAVSQGVKDGVTSTYGNPYLNRISTKDATSKANSVVDKILARSTLPAFFLTPFKAQAYNQIGQSLINAQKVSAAINATLEAQKPPTDTTDVEETEEAGEAGTSVHIDLNLTSFNLDSLNDATQIAASYGAEGVVVRLNSETEALPGVHNAAWDVTLETVAGEDQNNAEWHLQWVDGEGNSWTVVDDNGHIVVVGDDGEVQGDWTNEANWWAEAENGDVDAAVGSAIEDFVDAVIANSDKPNNVVINVGDQGLDWTYPPAIEAEAPATATP